jgi:hypothetical protein
MQDLFVSMKKHPSDDCSINGIANLHQGKYEFQFLIPNLIFLEMVRYRTLKGRFDFDVSFNSGYGVL